VYNSVRLLTYRRSFVEPLRIVLSRLQQELHGYGRSAHLVEAEVRARLIDPVLPALGWLGKDVRREYKAKGWADSVDYALMTEGDPRVLIEAKALDKNLDDPNIAKQVMVYLAQNIAEWIVLTNGDEYRIYAGTAPFKLGFKDTIFQTVRLSDEFSATYKVLRWLSRDQVLKNALKSKWRTFCVDRQVQRALEKIISPPTKDNPVDKRLVQLVAAQPPKLTLKDAQAGLNRVRPRLVFSGGPDLEPDEPLPLGAALQEELGQHSAMRGYVTFQLPSQQPSRPGKLWSLITHKHIRPGATLKAEYYGQTFEAQVTTSGQIAYDGELYTSPSGAAVAAIRTVRDIDAWNGWKFWYHEGECIDRLRDRRGT